MENYKDALLPSSSYPIVPKAKESASKTKLRSTVFEDMYKRAKQKLAARKLLSKNIIKNDKEYSKEDKNTGLLKALIKNDKQITIKLIFFIIQGFKFKGTIFQNEYLRLILA